MNVVFAILNILLFSLLCILSLFLLLLIIILFYPICYEIKADKNEKLYINAKGSWIFGIIRFRHLKNDETSDTVLSVLWFKLIGGKNPKQKSRTQKTPSENEPSHEKHENEKIGDEESEKSSLPEPSETVLEDIKENNDKDIEEDDTEDINLKDKFKNLKEKITSIRDKIDFILQYPNKKEILEYTWIFAKKLFSAMKPKKLKLKAEVGFDDPSLTGYALGGAYILRTLLMLNIDIEGNFEKQTLNFSFYVKGKIILMPIVYSFLRYILRKPIWKLITDLRKG